MSRLVSPILAAMAIVCCCLCSVFEIKNMIGGPEPEESMFMDPLEVDPSALLKPESTEDKLENLLGGSEAEHREENRRYFAKEFARKMGLPMSALTIGTTVEGTDSHIRILCQPAKRKEIVEKLDDLQFPLRLLKVRDVTLQERNGKVIEVYTIASDLFGYTLSRDLVVYESLSVWAKPLADFLARQCINHLDMCIKTNPLDPALVGYRWTFNKMLSQNTESDCKLLEGIESNAYIARPESAATATRLASIIGCTKGSTMPVDDAAQFVRESFNPDLMRCQLLKELYDTSGQPDKAKAALKELPEQRDKINQSIIVDLVCFALAGIALVFTVSSKGSFLRSDNSEPMGSIACPLAYGWIKPILITVFTVFCVVFGELLFMSMQPELNTEAGLLLHSYFEPMKVAVSFNLVELTMVLPFILASVALVGRKMNLLNYVRLQFKTKEHDLKKLITIGLECFSLSFAPAMVATLLSYWYRFPWEKASSASTDLIIASDSVPAMITLLIGYALVAPILEEIAFRGILHPFLRRGLSAGASIIVSSAIFSLAHFEFTPWWIADKFIFAAVNAYALEKTGSIVPGIINHVLTNAFVILVLILLAA